VLWVRPLSCASARPMPTPFYAESSVAVEVWTVRDASGFPAPETADGARAMAFWSGGWDQRHERPPARPTRRAKTFVTPVPTEGAPPPLGSPWEARSSRDRDVLTTSLRRGPARRRTASRRWQPTRAATVPAHIPSKS
jgi:hypothetical protein